MSYDPQRPQDPNNPNNPRDPMHATPPPARGGTPKWIWVAVAAVGVVVLFMLFSGGDRPDQMAPTADEAPVVTTDPMAPATGTPTETDPMVAPSDPVDSIDPIEQQDPAPVVE